MKVGVLAPTSVFSNINGNRTMQEMLSLANEVAQLIAGDTREWSRMKTSTVCVGDGVSGSFPLPANFKRMLLTTNVWRSTSSKTPMRFISDTDEWIRRRIDKTANTAFGEWMLMDGKIFIYPALAKNTLSVWSNGTSYYTIGQPVYDALDDTSWKVVVQHVSSGVGTFAEDRAANPTYWVSTPNVPQTASYSYLDKNCVNLATGGRGDSFIADGDSFVLDERLLKLGMIWQWKASKGSAYAEDMATYSDAMDVAKGSDKPAPIIIGKRPISVNATIAYPWELPS